MDDTTLTTLRSALSASPDNHELRAVIVQALVDRQDYRAAAELGSAVDPDAYAKTDQRIAAGEALLRDGSPEKALAYAGGDDPRSLVLRARILRELDRQDEARDAYREAVKANPTLEDKDLEASLGARVRQVEGNHADGAKPGRPKLRVISNDNTDRDEVPRLLHPEDKRVTFADVGGLADVKKQIDKRIILPFKKPSLFQRFRKRVGGGILLYGPPGCGKTLLARATAGECGATFFNVAISDILDMYIGESERKLHAIFEKARSSAPAVMFFDELEALAGKRQYSREGTSSKLVSQFLSEMDGFAQNNRGVLVLGATNVPWAVDPAFRRPGRFDRVVFVPPPDKQARKAILELLLDGRPTEGNIDVERLATKTSGFSGADLENLVEAATDEAIEASLEQEHEQPVRSEHLNAALSEVKPTTLEWLTTARNYARYANEAGQYDEVLAFLEKHGKR